jgi:signal transduction histidine kinase
LGPNITIDVEIRDDLPLVEIDPNQLESALLNLALNARDAINGQGPLRVSAHAGSPGQQEAGTLVGHFVCLSVEDRGERMDERTLNALPSLSSKGVGKGTGLGLSMVHGLAEQSGGTLILKSPLEKERLPNSGCRRPLTGAPRRDHRPWLSLRQTLISLANQ